jgi:hypothetical protein
MEPSLTPRFDAGRLIETAAAIRELFAKPGQITRRVSMNWEPQEASSREHVYDMALSPMAVYHVFHLHLQWKKLAQHRHDLKVF